MAQSSRRMSRGHNSMLHPDVLHASMVLHLFVLTQLAEIQQDGRVCACPPTVIKQYFMRLGALTHVALPCAGSACCLLVFRDAATSTGSQLSSLGSSGAAIDQRGRVSAAQRR